jgi:hypothetical protein
MKTKITKFCTIIPKLFLKGKFFVFILINVAVGLTSCNDMFDNMNEYKNSEKIYPAHFEAISGKIGYERVEIDLSTIGRISSSQMNLAKAQKTIVEYDDKVITIDSVCSWVNITGLTKPKLYRFVLYTMNSYGDKSIPVEISLTPYTSDDLNTLGVNSPVLTLSTSSGLVEWQSKLSNDMYDVYGYTYEYIDKDNMKQAGGGKSDIPSFFIKNVSSPLTINMTYKIVPKISGIPIIDTIEWHKPIALIIPPDVKPAILLNSPTAGFILDANESVFPYTFSWIKTQEVNDYTLKLSRSSTFSPESTISFNVGNTDHFELDEENVNSLLGDAMVATCYWTVMPSVEMDVNTQTRQFIAKREFSYAGGIYKGNTNVWWNDAQVGEDNPNWIVTIRVNEGERTISLSTNDMNFMGQWAFTLNGTGTNGGGGTSLLVKKQSEDVYAFSGEVEVFFVLWYLGYQHISGTFDMNGNLSFDMNIGTGLPVKFVGVKQ